VVASFRKLVGATDPLKAEPGTIRGDFGRVTGRNIVHASDSPDNGEREAGERFIGVQYAHQACRKRHALGFIISRMSSETL